MEDFLLSPSLVVWFELTPALVDLRCSEVPSRAVGTVVDLCELCVADALAVDPDSTAHVLDPAFVVRTLPLASSEEEVDLDVTVSSESPADVLDVLDLASSVVSPPSVLPEEEGHDVEVSPKVPADLLDPAVAAALLRSAVLEEEEEALGVTVPLELPSCSSAFPIAASCISTFSVSASIHLPTFLELESCDEVGCPARRVFKSDSRIPGERKTLSREPSVILLVCCAVVSCEGTMVMLPARRSFIPSFLFRWI
jgi:hypothetical protein